MYDGVLPGRYYRAGSEENRAGSYGHCSRVAVEAGEVLTLVHFNVPRHVDVNTTHPSQNMFDSRPLTMSSQHTVWNGFAHFPDPI